MAERVTIQIQTGNAAFDESPTREVARILRDLASRFERDGLPPETLRDLNGNACGTVAIEARVWIDPAPRPVLEELNGEGVIDV